MKIASPEKPAVPQRRSRYWAWIGGLALMIVLPVAWASTHYAGYFLRFIPYSDPEASEPPLPVMDEEQREFIWEAEHLGNVLAKYGFKVLAEALSRADEQALSDLLAPDFQGQILHQPRKIEGNTEILKVVREQEAGSAGIPLNRAEFIRWLLDYRQLFHKPPKVAVKYITLSPVVREEVYGLWEGKGFISLQGEIKPGQPGEVEIRMHYRIVRPEKEMLAQGGWFHACRVTQTQVAHAKRWLLREVAAERGIDPNRLHDNWIHGGTHGVTGGVFLCDFNRDAIPDVLLTDLNGYTFYKGLRGGKFADVTTQVGLPRKLPRGGGVDLVATFADLDGDGWEDLVLGSRLFRNDNGKRFVDVTLRSNLQLMKHADDIAIADFDRDGRIDLYVTRPGQGEKGSWLTGKSGDKAGNQLWRNKGNWQFEDVTAASGTDGDQRSTFTAVWLDANNDNWPDLHVINEFGNGVLLVNQGDGTFRGHALGEGPVDFGSMGATTGDFDNDGNIDLYISNMYSKAGTRVINNMRPGTYPEDVMAKIRRFVAGSQLHRNLGGLRFEQLGEEYQVAAVGWAYGPAFADLDNDGWLDIYATAGYISQSRTEPDG